MFNSMLMLTVSKAALKFNSKSTEANLLSNLSIISLISLQTKLHSRDLFYIRIIVKCLGHCCLGENLVFSRQHVRLVCLKTVELKLDKSSGID